MLVTELTPAKQSRHDLRVVPPYRLDVTVSALRRLPSNAVDLLTAEGAYVRALEMTGGCVVARVTHTAPQTLTVTLQGPARDHAAALALIARTLGVDRDLAHFDAAAQRVPWLQALALRMRGVKPPRYPTLWEACVNAVAFQQISLAAASAIMGRLVVAHGRRVESDATTLYAFPTVETFLGTEDVRLRATGLSAGKVAALRQIGEALVVGALDEAELERRSSAEAATILSGLRGIGPWTAAVILLRGVGRLDVFPARDTGVARNLAMLGDAAPLDIDAALETLRPEQGMLYYHLLLARLEARGELGRPSTASAVLAV